MKNTYILGLILVVFALVGCQANEDSMGGTIKKHETTFYDTFDTFVQVTFYTDDEELATEVKELAHKRFLELHMLFDKYHEYDGMNNVKTINNMAGKEPVKVEPELLDLIIKSKEWNKNYSPMTDIAIGPLTKIWHDYRSDFEQGIDVGDDESQVHTTETKLPNIEELKAAATHIDMNKIIVNEEASTIFLEDEAMALDVGAVAKGYATELVAQEMKAAGIRSALINAGGNTRVIGSPVDGRDSFVIGVQNPMVFDDPTVDNLKATIKINDKSVVTSGDYQRYYIVDGKRYHHIIHPRTLMPADNFRSVTIITEDSGLCDFLSTAVFCMPYEEGRALIDGLDYVEGIWIHPDGSVDYTDGLSDKLELRE